MNGTKEIEDADKSSALRDRERDVDVSNSELADKRKTDLRNEEALLDKKDDESVSGIMADSVPVQAHGAKVDYSRKKFRVLAGTIVVLILVICMATLYNLVWPPADKSCMYWTGDHYEPMSCDESKPDTLKLPMDEIKLRTFRRILREDTITEYSIGKIYYIKMNGRIEYYTTKGNHPVEVNRNVHKLSQHIFDKYLREK